MPLNGRGEAMEVETFSAVRLKNGSEGTVVDVWKNGVACEFEPDDRSDLDEGAPLAYAISHNDIEEALPFPPRQQE